MIARSLALGILAVGLASPALAQQSAAQATARQQIAAFMNQWIDAYNRRDARTMATLTTADAIGVGDLGVVSGAERFERAVQNATAFDAKVTGIAVQQVRMIGPDAAVAAGPFSVTYNNPGPLTMRGTWMQVLERQQGGWKSVAASYTPSTVPMPPAVAGAGNPQPSAGSSVR
ncbi:MAG TPA: nuclear transport factor 2 family protein [Stellaceae bacterium]|nr:nuclear transport factor 2 family protein [Stellaceae bacterium]